MSEKNVREAEYGDSYDYEREGARRSETSIGLDENVASAVAYALGFLSGIAVFFLEKDNQHVRWHAAQSIVTFGVLVVGTWILQTVLWSVVFSSFAFGLWGFVSLLTTLVWLGVLVLWAFLVIRAYQGVTVRVPVAAGIADGLVR
jgi:uncharacterized membrane protein